MRSNWERLGELVKAERARQQRTLAGFARDLGMSRATLDSIEHNRKTSYEPATLAALEDGMGWLPGSVDRVLAGLNPKANTDPDLTEIIDAWPRLSLSYRRILRIIAAEGSKAED